MGYSRWIYDQPIVWWDDSRSRWVQHTVRKEDFKFKETTLPQSLILARYGALPALEIESALRSLCGFGDETKGMILPPLLSVRYG